MYGDWRTKEPCYSAPTLSIAFLLPRTVTTMSVPRRCVTCGSTFTTIIALREHCSAHSHSLSPYICNPCNRSSVSVLAMWVKPIQFFICSLIKWIICYNSIWIPLDMSTTPSTVYYEAFKHGKDDDNCPLMGRMKTILVLTIWEHIWTKIYISTCLKFKLASPLLFILSFHFIYSMQNNNNICP